ncbi:MAG: hypothetical protein WCJ30_20100, partial [Deltaproteobacteria bacterium]
FVGGRRIFPEVRPVSPNVWVEPQRRRVRYQFNADRAGTMTVQIVGRQQPLVIPIRGYVPVATDAGTPR